MGPFDSLKRSISIFSGGGGRIPNLLGLEGVIAPIPSPRPIGHYAASYWCNLPLIFKCGHVCVCLEPERHKFISFNRVIPLLLSSHGSYMSAFSFTNRADNNYRKATLIF